MNVKKSEADKLIAWWKETDHSGMDYDKYVLVPLMEAMGDNIEEIFDYLESLPMKELEIVYGCFENIYKKFTTEKVWVELGRLEDKLIEIKQPWKVQAKRAYLQYEDEQTYFDSFQKDDFYIVHGEIFIYCFDTNFKKLWDFSARDIWVRQDGLPALILHDEYIELHDWLGYTYEVTYEGKLFKDEKM